MKLSFRQGIARYQSDVYATPSFLQKSSLNAAFVDLIVSPDPTIISFAHKSANYIVEETKTVRNAWGPISNVATQYLYWDVNVLDAVITRGITTLPPISSFQAPASPAVGQHWFDLDTTTMRVWEAPGRWAERIRVFAGYVTNGGVLRPNPIGTQCGITGDFEGGNIVLDSFAFPLRESNGCFVTTVSQLAIVALSSKKVRFEAEVLSGIATEYIPKYSLVRLKPGRRLELGRSLDWKTRIAGMVDEDLYQNEVGLLITDGLVRNEQWNWAPELVGKPIFCGTTGAITIIPPEYGVCQIVGRIYDTDCIYIDIHQPIVLVSPEEMEVPIAPPSPPPLGAPAASFTFAPSGGAAPLEVTFTSTSTNSPTLLEWDFFGDGEYDAIGSTATFTFAAAGTYTIRLRATNGVGTSTSEQSITIQPAIPGGVEINLGITVNSIVDAVFNQVFPVTLAIDNSGLLTATGVVRTVAIPDVRGQQILVTGVTGGTLSRTGGITYITYNALPPLPTSGSISTTFSLRAPNVQGNILLSASVTANEVDATIGDNTVSQVIEVKP